MSSDAKKISHLFFYFQSIFDFYKSTWTWCFRAKDMIFLFYSVFSIELPGNNTGTTTFLLKAEKWYLNVLLFLLCQPNAKEVIEFLSNTVKKFVGKHFTLQKQTIHICIATKIIFFWSLQKEDNLQLCTTCTSLDILWFIIFFQGKSRENLALISHNSQWDPMVMKLWPWKTSLELKR